MEFAFSDKVQRLQARLQAFMDEHIHPNEQTYAGQLAGFKYVHEVLEHRWYMSERAGSDVTVATAVEDYVRSVLPAKPDEASVLGVDTASTTGAVVSPE